MEAANRVGTIRISFRNSLCTRLFRTELARSHLRLTGRVMVQTVVNLTVHGSPATLIEERDSFSQFMPQLRFLRDERAP